MRKLIYDNIETLRYGYDKDENRKKQKRIDEIKRLAIIIANPTIKISEIIQLMDIHKNTGYKLMNQGKKEFYTRKIQKYPRLPEFMIEIKLRRAASIDERGIIESLGEIAEKNFCTHESGDETCSCLFLIDTWSGLIIINTIQYLSSNHTLNIIITTTDLKSIREIHSNFSEIFEGEITVQPIINIL